MGRDLAMRWTLKRIDAALDAINAMLAGEEGEGDCGDTSFEDLKGARDLLIAMRENLLKNRTLTK